jgi:hypothetical protein
MSSIAYATRGKKESGDSNDPRQKGQHHEADPDEKRVQQKQEKRRFRGDVYPFYLVSTFLPNLLRFVLGQVFFEKLLFFPGVRPAPRGVRLLGNRKFRSPLHANGRFGDLGMGFVALASLSAKPHSASIVLSATDDEDVE